MPASLARFCRCANNARAMGTQLFHSAQTLSDTATPSIIRGKSPPALPVVRYGLRQLFCIVAALCLILAALAASPNGPAPLLMITAVLIVLAHVAGTAIGSRLRQHANDVRAWEAEHRNASCSATDATERSGSLDVAVLPPVSPWYRRGGTALGWLPKMVAVGAILGGCSGIAVFASDTLSHRVPLAGILVGAVSFAILGAWLAFIGGSFYAIFRHGLREAMAHERHDQSRSTIGRT